MARQQDDNSGTGPTLSLIVLSGDASLGDSLKAMAAARPAAKIDVTVARDPEAARAALAQRRHGIVLQDLRGQRAADGNLLSALPVLKRLGAIIALVDAEDAPNAIAAHDAGVGTVIAFADLSPALLHHAARHALAERAAENRLQRLRLHEPVIGIPSQILFWEILLLAVRRAKRNRDFFAVLLIDLDNLPDGEGPAGPYRDLALRDLVDRIQPILRTSDTVARLETQQLAILVESMPRVEDIQIVAEKIIEEVELPLSDGSPAALEAAIGIALFPTSADSAEDMLARATDAMLQARERGRNRFAFA